MHLNLCYGKIYRFHQFTFLISIIIQNNLFLCTLGSAARPFNANPTPKLAIPIRNDPVGGRSSVLPNPKPATPIRSDDVQPQCPDQPPSSALHPSQPRRKRPPPKQPGENSIEMKM